MSSVSGLLRLSWSHIRFRSLARQRKSTGRSICHTLSSSSGLPCCLRGRVPGWVLMSCILPCGCSRGWLSATGLDALGGGGGLGRVPPPGSARRWFWGGCSTSRVPSELGVFRMDGMLAELRVSMIWSSSVGPSHGKTTRYSSRLQVPPLY